MDLLVAFFGSLVEKRPDSSQLLKEGYPTVSSGKHSYIRSKRRLSHSTKSHRMSVLAVHEHHLISGRNDFGHPPGDSVHPMINNWDKGDAQSFLVHKQCNWAQRPVSSSPSLVAHGNT